MKLVSIKSPSEMTLPGVHVALEKENDTVVGILLTNEKGDTFCIRGAESYSRSIKIFRRQDFETKKVHRLQGTVLGIKVSEDFDEEYDATSRRDKILAKDASAELAIVECTIKVDDAGNAIESNASDSEIPF